MSFELDDPLADDWAQFLVDFDTDPSAGSADTIPTPIQIDTPELGQTLLVQNRVTTDSVDASLPAKVGTRFSIAALKVLKGWLREHEKHPYPSPNDVSRLSAQTGLENQQILNWYANVRRRTKIRHIPRPTSPSLSVLKAHELPAGTCEFMSPPQTIPQGPSQLSFRHMNPMQRWQNSPPEHEPSEAADILAAVRSLTHENGCDDQGTSSSYSEGFTPSVTSTVRSNSSTGSSVASAYSYASRSPRHSIDLLAVQKPKRRRRKVTRRGQLGSGHGLSTPSRTYQCTFCAETFSTKHNWQRHEKSLHISLEGWKCSPDGPIAYDANHIAICVYCGTVSPNLAHIAAHDYEECEKRKLEERIFYRKDHLQQHLTLVHNATFQKATMEQWKEPSLCIRSRCGFCSLEMSTWDERVDHIAEHFKTGKTMADWEGGWGFEPHVADKVESAIPPYLIHYERHSPWPFTTFQGAHEVPMNAFELISAEMEHYSNEAVAANQRHPTMAEMQYECCNRIFAAEQLTAIYNSLSKEQDVRSSDSWLRDLIMSNESIAREARRCPVKDALKASITSLRVIGKSTLFESCALEQELQQHVQGLQTTGLPVTDEELRIQACQIVTNTIASASRPSKVTQDFLIQLISNECATWLIKFRLRAGLPLEDDRLPLISDPDNGNGFNGSITDSLLEKPAYGESDRNDTLIREECGQHPEYEIDVQGYRAAVATSEGQLGYDSCYRQLMKGLANFARCSMAPFNPNRHVPTDAELQHQARWIMYEDDDPWNQTPADNAEWLRQFKRDHIPEAW